MRLSTAKLQDLFKYRFDSAAAAIHTKAARSSAPTEGNGPEHGTYTGGRQCL
jgi:hypothetical protein